MDTCSHVGPRRYDYQEIRSLRNEGLCHTTKEATRNNRGDSWGWGEFEKEVEEGDNEYQPFTVLRPTAASRGAVCSTDLPLRSFFSGRETDRTVEVLLPRRVWSSASVRHKDGLQRPLTSLFQGACCEECGGLTISGCCILWPGTTFVPPQAASSWCLSPAVRLELGHFSTTWLLQLAGASAIRLAALQSGALSTRPSFLSSLLCKGQTSTVHWEPTPPSPAPCPLSSQALLSINLSTSFYLGVLLLGGPKLGQIVSWILIFRTPYKLWYTFILLLYSSAILYNPPQFHPFSLQPLAHFQTVFVNLYWNLAVKPMFMTISN